MGWQRRELRRQLKWLMAFRVVITTTLLVCVFVIELLYRPLLSLKPFYLLAIFTYLLTIGYAVLMRMPRWIQAQVYVQLVGDIALLTAFVYVTGGSESPFSFLYLPSIIVGCILLPRRRGGFAVAGWSWVMYACRYSEAKATGRIAVPFCNHVAEVYERASNRRISGYL